MGGKCEVHARWMRGNIGEMGNASYFICLPLKEGDIVEGKEVWECIFRIIVWWKRKKVVSLQVESTHSVSFP